MSSRWSDYFLTHQFSEFWSERLAQADASVCLIVAIGFDPRCRTALKHILAVAPPERVGFIGLRIRSAVDSLESTRLANEAGDQNLQSTFIEPSDRSRDRRCSTTGCNGFSVRRLVERRAHTISVPRRSTKALETH